MTPPMVNPSHAVESDPSEQSGKLPHIDVDALADPLQDAEMLIEFPGHPKPRAGDGHRTPCPELVDLGKSVAEIKRSNAHLGIAVSAAVALAVAALGTWQTVQIKRIEQTSGASELAKISQKLDALLNAGR